MATKDMNFWESKKLDEFNSAEWELLCDRCGLCCLRKVEDECTGEVFNTKVLCSNYDGSTKKCSSYSTRFKTTSNCVQLTPELVRKFDWLPTTCAYKLILKKMPLPKTHPLITGNYQKIKTVIEYFKKNELILNTKSISIEKHIIDRDIS
jgi:uncharacterized protein